MLGLPNPLGGHPRMQGAGYVVAYFLLDHTADLWSLVSEKPLFPLLQQYVTLPAIGERRVGDVLGHLPAAVIVALLVGVFLNTRTPRPVMASATLDIDEIVDGILFRRHAIGPGVWAPTKWLCPEHGIELQDASTEGHERSIPPRQVVSFAVRDSTIHTVRCAGLGEAPPHSITHEGNYWRSLADANVRLDAKVRAQRAR